MHNVSAAGMEMLGLGTDWLGGRGCVNQTPLLLGTWEQGMALGANPIGRRMNERIW
jgi:microsomal dipeptidase-like Zn-dependent dipeptidase